MPVRPNVGSDLITDQRLDQNPPDPAKARGVAHCIAGTMTNLSTDSSTSTYLLCQIPANAILDARTAFSTAGAGFATINVGTRVNSTALYTGAKAAIINPIAMGDAKHGLPAWQQLGLSAPPDGNMIDLIFTASANATGNGTMPFEIWYRDHQ